MVLERTTRQVIDGKLLAILDDDDKVAIVLNELDISLLISAVQNQMQEECGPGEKKRRLRLGELLAGMMELADEAFGDEDWDDNPAPLN